MPSTIDKRAVVRATNHLIKAGDYSTIVRGLRRVLKDYAAYPMRYSDELEYMNALLDLGLQSERKLDKILRGVEARRRLIPTARRLDYMRDFMRQRRSRVAAAVAQHERRRGPLTRPARETFIKELGATWRKRKNAFLREHKADDMPWDKRNEVLARFWQHIDEELAEN